MLMSSDLGCLMCQVLHKGLQMQRSQAGSFPMAGRLVHASRNKDIGQGCAPLTPKDPRFLSRR